MIVPTAAALDLNLVASAASDLVGKEPDYEVFGPSELVTVVTRYVTHAPRDFQLVNGVRFSTSSRGTGTITLMATVNGNFLFAGNQTLAADSQIIPMSAVSAAWQNSVIPAGAKVELLIHSAPADGSGTSAWRGLRMAWLGRTPGLSSVNAGLALPQLALWPRTLSTEPKGAGGAALAASYGSGCTYWPEKGTLLTVDNASGTIIEMTTAGIYVRTITLTGFSDVESLSYIDGLTFCLTEEDLGTIVVFDIPLTGAVTVIKGGANWIRTIAAGIAVGSATGLEGVAYDLATDTFITTPEKAVAGAWNIYRVTNATTPTVTVLFSVYSGMAGVGTDISDLTLTAARTLLLASDEGATASDTYGRLVEFTLEGRLIQQTNVPGISQLEGVALDPANDRIFLTGEPAGGPNMQLQVWQRP
jgi:uncharacterized protein YjiK